MEKEKPINPKYVFDGKVKNKKGDKNYRKPKGEDNAKKPLISLNDW